MYKVPFQLLELTIISAQDLAPASKHLRTYAVAWIDPKRKLRTRIDNQTGNNPTWNDKFLFRVDDAFLNSDTSLVKIEIFRTGWIRDNQVGSVHVMIKNLIPPEVRQDNNSSRRFVALQIRRSSGRPRGILTMGVTLLDNTMHSMPIDCHQVIAKGPNENNNEKMITADEKVKLQRSLSDKSDLTTKQGQKDVKKKKPLPNGSLVNYEPAGSVVYPVGSIVNGSAVNGGSMLNGSICNSDIGPSPSVVAAAISMGLYPTQLGPPPKPGSSVLEDWKVEEVSMEGMKSRMERWRLDIPTKFDHKYQRLGTGSGREKKNGRRKSVDLGTGESGLFRCFGNSYGCEFTIVCGSNGKKKNKGRGNGQGSTSDLEC